MNGKDAMRRLQPLSVSSSGNQAGRILSCCAAPARVVDEKALGAALSFLSKQGDVMQAAGDVKNPCKPWEFFDPLAKDDPQVKENGGCIVGMCRTPSTKPDSNRVCSTLTPAEARLANSVTEQFTSLKLTHVPAGYDMNTVLSPGSDQDRFVSDFLDQLAEQLGVPKQMFKVTAVREGSIIIDFKIETLTLEEQNALGTATPPAPTLVLASLDAVRSNLKLANPSSILGYTDPIFGTSSTKRTQASAGSALQALLSSFKGDTLDQIPPKVINNPLLYSIAKVGLANRDKASEYLPRNRAKYTEDEKWVAPSEIALDVAMFISPARSSINPDHFCTIGGVTGDPIAARYLVGAPPSDLQGESVMMRDFHSWQVPVSRRMNVGRCSVGDWLETQQMNAGVPQEQINVTSRAVGAGNCGVPDSVWRLTNCATMSFLSDEYPNKYMKRCNPELFPSSQWNYSVFMPLNNRWVMQTSRISSMTYLPEWQLDFGINYFFTWSTIDDETERLFKQGMPPGGDNQLINETERCQALGFETSPCVEKVIYSGPILYKGQHSGDTKRTVESAGIALHQLPATSPANKLRFVLRLDHDLTKSLVSRASPDDWAEDDVLDLILKCNDFELRTIDIEDECQRNHVPTAIFPYNINLKTALAQVSIAEDGSIALEPGTLVTFEVSLSIQPKYKQLDNWLATQRLVTWTVSVLQIQAIKTRPLPFNKRNQGQVRVKVKVDSDARQVIEVYSFTLMDFITRAGSWVGIWGFANLLVLMIFTFVKPFGVLGPLDADVVVEQAQDRHNEKIERRRARAVAQIKARLEAEYPGIQIDDDKVARHLVDQEDTVGRLLQTPLEELVVKGEENATGGLPDLLVDILADLDT